jgi:hypothetical protein
VVHRRQRAWLSEALVIATLVLLPLLFWWRLWAPSAADRAVIPEGDFSSQYYPLQLFAARELADGRLPAWNPYINAGQPALADIQTGAFYPANLLPNLALALLDIDYGIGLLTAQVVLHHSLASLFTYLFARHLARRSGARVPTARFAGATAALTFTYAGYLTSFPVQQLTILETAVWLPLILFFLDRAFHHSQPLPQIVLTAMALACALLAGHPQTAMYVVYTAVAYGLFLAWSTRRPKSKPWVPEFLWRASYRLGLPLVLGVALAAVQFVPTLEFIFRSTRAGLNYEAVAWGFPLAEITHLLYPGYFGGSPQYVGILSPILAAAAWYVRRARRQVVFWSLVGVVALFLAFGGHTFFYNIAYLLVPGFGAVRNQERIIFLFSFAVSVLAGYGALTLVQPVARQARKGFGRFTRGIAWVFAVFLALTALWYSGYLRGQQLGVEVNLFEGVLRHHSLAVLIMAGSTLVFGLRRARRARRRWWMLTTLALIGLNLFTVNWRYNLGDAAAGGVFPETGTVAVLKQQVGTFRISSAGLLPGGSSAGAVYEIEDITANTPLRLDAFQRFEDQVGSWRRWQLLNVRYVLDQREIDGPGLERIYEEGEVKVYQVGDPLPRAWVVHDTVTAGDDEAIELLNADSFDPRATAVLPPGGDEIALSRGSRRGSVAQIVERAPGKLVLDVSPDGEGLLVISQPFYPGWQAQVDGARAHIHRVDYMLQGIALGAGTHRVELTFHLPAWPAIASLVVLAGCIVVLASFRAARRLKVHLV